MTYTVLTEHKVDADSPEEAARKVDEENHQHWRAKDYVVVVAGRLWNDGDRCSLCPTNEGGRMSETPEGIGGRKWSLLSDKAAMIGDVEVGDVVELMEGKTPLAILTDAGAKVKLLFVTIPQLWGAANEFLKATRDLATFYDGVDHRATQHWQATVEQRVADTHREEELQRRIDETRDMLGKMVAKAVGKTDWKDVAQ